MNPIATILNELAPLAEQKAQRQMSLGTNQKFYPLAASATNLIAAQRHVEGDTWLSELQCGVLMFAGAKAPEELQRCLKQVAATAVACCAAIQNHRVTQRDEAIPARRDPEGEPVTAARLKFGVEVISTATKLRYQFQRFERDGKIAIVKDQDTGHHLPFAMADLVRWFVITKQP